MKAKIKKPKIKLYSIILVFVACLVLAIICGLLFDSPVNDKKIASDQFGQFSTVERPIEVKNSPIASNEFKLSEKIIVDESYTENSSVPIRLYEQTYGSYPIFTTELEGSRLTTAFAISLLGLDYKKANIFTQGDKTVMPYLLKYTTDRNTRFVVELDSDNALSQTHIGFKDKYADLSIVSGDLKLLKKISKEMETPIVYGEFARDALVVFTSKENPVDSITKEELKKIYSGEIKDWKDLGGNKGKIKKFERAVYSSAERAFNLYVNNINNPKDEHEIFNIEKEMFDREEYINSAVSIGYCLRSQFELSYANDSNIKILNIDGVSLDEESIYTKEYPICVPYYYVYRQSEENSTGGKFAKWMQSEEGKRCIRSVGMIPTSGDKGDIKTVDG